MSEGVKTRANGRESRNGEAYSERFDDEVFVRTSSLSDVSSDFGDELQRGFVHGDGGSDEGTRESERKRLRDLGEGNGVERSEALRCAFTFVGEVLGV